MKITKKILKKIIKEETQGAIEELIDTRQPKSALTKAFKQLFDAVEAIKKADDKTKQVAAADALNHVKSSAQGGAAAAAVVLRSLAPALGIGADLLKSIVKESNT